MATKKYRIYAVFGVSQTPTYKQTEKESWQVQEQDLKDFFECSDIPVNSKVEV